MDAEPVDRSSTDISRPYRVEDCCLTDTVAKLFLPRGTASPTRGFYRPTQVRNDCGLMLAGQDPEQVLDTALKALSTDRDWKLVLDALPTPIYTTDAAGSVTYWNRACTDFAGREPQLGRDRWCVTWRIYSTSGEFMPHEKCPMADAIREQRIIRDRVAIAERPDGIRRAFRAYPTPLFDETGGMVGAVNMLIDVTEQQNQTLHQQADRCRRLADATYDRTTCKTLREMAEGFDNIADGLVGKPTRRLDQSNSSSTASSSPAALPVARSTSIFTGRK